jgi:hypothetical protein
MRNLIIYVMGNIPWMNLENIYQEHGKASDNIWGTYGLKAKIISE